MHPTADTLLLIISKDAGRRVMPGVRFPKRCMYYWRDKSFQALAEAANYASAVPTWAEYGRFCELLGKGLRKEAFKHLAAFIDDAAEWPFSEKRKFASWLYDFAHEREDSFGSCNRLAHVTLRA